MGRPEGAVATWSWRMLGLVQGLMYRLGWQPRRLLRLEDYLIARIIRDEGEG